MYKILIGKNNDCRRENWVKKTLEKIPKGYRILDAGAGEGRYKKYCDHLVCVSQDFAQYNGYGDSTGLQNNSAPDYSNLSLISDIVSIPVEEKTFDAVMCTEVFEHIPDPIAAINEFRRILKPGGYLIITAPFASGTHMAP